MVVWSLRVVAPLQHVRPRPVDRRASHAVGFPKATATGTLLGVAHPHYASLAAVRAFDLRILVTLAGSPDSLKLVDYDHDLSVFVSRIRRTV